jgi:uncharacterized ferredoxin-like protein
MPILRDNEIDSSAVITVAELMAASARTAPKGGGQDNTSTLILTGKEKDKLADAMEHRQEKKKETADIFKRDAEGVRKSQAVLLIGVRGTKPKTTSKGVSLNCGACGYESCGQFIKSTKKKGEDFIGPNCVFEVLDLGVALGSAVKTASTLNIDNRISYTVGAAAKDLELLDADLIIGIPLSATGKNPFFDRK